jgi:ATP-dependent DNA ligase
MRKRRLGADQPDHERQGVRQRHRLGVAVEVLGSKTTCVVVLCAFYLLELDGRDLRREPIERRKAALSGSLAAGLALSLRLVEG